MPALRKLLRFLSSYRLACVLFLLLLLLTYLGTLYQVDHGLYQSKQKYFESYLLVHQAWGVVPVPLPGAYLVLLVLFVNLVLGAIVRARKGWSKLGILVAHSGILVLLAGAFVSYEFSDSGHMTLYEGDSADYFESSADWEIGVREAGTKGPTTEYVLQPGDFQGLKASQSRTFSFAAMPFDLTLSGYLPNCEWAPARPDAHPKSKVVDGRCLEPRDLDAEEERNIAGAYATAREKNTGTTHEGIVWGAAGGPFTVPAGEKTFAVELRRRRGLLPFALALDKFTRELHPRTNMPKEFTSDVTKVEKGVSQRFRISMNAPLRSHGYTFYQSSWGPPGAGEGDRLYSVLAVARNPAERFPLYACFIITVGLFLHFAQQLWRYLKTESARTP